MQSSKIKSEKKTEQSFVKLCSPTILQTHKVVYKRQFRLKINHDRNQFPSKDEEKKVIEKKIMELSIPLTSSPPRNRSQPFNRIFSPNIPKNSSKLSLPNSVCVSRVVVVVAT